jgi:RNA polymerase sigma-70 factor (ECF subfamily)
MHDSGGEVAMGGTPQDPARHGVAANVSFEDWYRMSHDRLLAAVVMLLRDRDEAREVVAEACARCLDRWATHRRPRDPTSWTFRVAVNVAHRRGRRRRTEREAIDRLRPGLSPTVSAPALDLWHAVAQLPERQRLAVVLRYVGDLSEAQTAEVMGIAPGTVGATLSAARRNLAECLDIGEDVHDAS